MKEFDEQAYQQNIKTFLTEKGSVEDGHAAERVVTMLEQTLAALG